MKVPSLDLESSLIGAVEVKLLLLSTVEVKLLLLSGRMGAPAGHSLLFAVGAGTPHDGVMKARRLNLSHDLAGVPPAGSGLSTRSPRHRPHRNDPVCPLGAGVGSPFLFRRPRGPRRGSGRSGTRSRRSTCDAG